MRPLAICLLAAVFAAPAQAESISFSYEWSAVPGVFPSGTGTVSFAAAPNGGGMVELGSLTPASVPVMDITSSSSAAAETPDTFAAPFSMTLKLTDSMSGDSGELTFGGSLIGTLTFSTSTLTAAFDGQLTKQITLGGHAYSVTLDHPSVDVLAPGAGVASLSAQVTAADTVGTPPVQQVPEPGSLLLASLAVLPLVALRGRRRAKASAEADDKRSSGV